MQSRRLTSAPVHLMLSGWRQLPQHPTLLRLPGPCQPCRDHRQLVPADHQSHRRRPGRRKCCAATEAETLKASTEGGKELRRHQSHSYVACFLADAQPAVSAVTPPGPCGNSWLGHLRDLTSFVADRRHLVMSSRSTVWASSRHSRPAPDCRGPPGDC